MAVAEEDAVVAAEGAAAAVEEAAEAANLARPSHSRADICEFATPHLLSLDGRGLESGLSL